LPPGSACPSCAPGPGLLGQGRSRSRAASSRLGAASSPPLEGSDELVLDFLEGLTCDLGVLGQRHDVLEHLLPAVVPVMGERTDPLTQAGVPASLGGVVAAGVRVLELGSDDPQALAPLAEHSGVDV